MTTHTSMCGRYRYMWIQISNRDSRRVLHCLHNYINLCDLCSICCFSLYVFVDACRTPIAPYRGQWQNPLPLYLPGHNLTFTCDEGYGPFRSSHVTCQFDGSWAGGQPLCTSKICFVTTATYASCFNYSAITLVMHSDQCCIYKVL